MNKYAMVFATLTLLATQTPIAVGANIAEGKRKSASCQACHGVDGNSPSAEFPKLAGQHADYLKMALMDYKTGVRKNPIMSGFAAPLSEQDMADLAAYFASQSGLKLKY